MTGKPAADCQVGARPPFFGDPRCACRGHDWNLFCPPDHFGTAEVHAAMKAAKRICLAGPCPVLDDCRDWALDRGERGVWGGTTDLERERIRHHRAGRAVVPA